MYSSVYQFLRKYLLPGHQEIRRCLKELESSQWLTRGELEEVQLKKIQRLVSYAYEYVPFYRQRYQREGIHPQDIKSLKDFQALPFLTRTDVKNHRGDLVSTVYRGGVFEGKTSGSTGEPMRFIMDSSAAYWSYAVEARCRGWYGVRRGNKMAWITGSLQDYPEWKWKDRLAAKIKRYRYLNARTMTENKMQAFTEMLIRWQPEIIRVYPQALSVFAHYLKERHITSIKPRLIETTAEKITPSMRGLFEEIFHAPVADHYSSLEIFSYAYQCPQGGIHVNEERYLELVESGQVVDDGKMGEVVVTALNQYAMPFIRYKNGDVGIYETGGCSCGRGMPVLQEIVGRNNDLLVRPDGQIVHSVIVDDIIISKYQYGVQQFQIYQPDREHLEVRLLCRQRVAPALLEDIRNELQPSFGGMMNISVIQVDNIEPTEAGKRHYVISKVKTDFM